MGDGYNTWGGKNNSWGNRNRKNGGNGRGGQREEPNKLFNVFIGGLVLFAIAGTGLGKINDVIDKVKDTKDTKDIVETMEKVTSPNESSSNNKIVNKNIKDNVDITNNGLDIDISAADVRDFLLKVSEGTGNELDIGKIEKIETFSYGDVNTLDTYIGNVMSKVNSTDKNIIILILHKATGDEGEWDTVTDTISDIASATMHSNIDSSKHTRYSLKAHGDFPSGYITIALIYQ